MISNRYYFSCCIFIPINFRIKSISAHSAQTLPRPRAYIGWERECLPYQIKFTCSSVEFPGKSGRLDSISPKMQPKLHKSTPVV